MSFASNTPIQFIPSIGWRTTKVLHDLDIYTIGQLKQVPEKMLIELFGPSIRHILQLISGQPRRDQQTTVQTTNIFNQSHATQHSGRHTSFAIQGTKKSFFKRLQLAAQFITVL